MPLRHGHGRSEADELESFPPDTGATDISKGGLTDLVNFRKRVIKRLKRKDEPRASGFSRPGPGRPGARGPGQARGPGPGAGQGPGARGRPGALAPSKEEIFEQVVARNSGPIYTRVQKESSRSKWGCCLI